MKILITGGCGFLGSHICEYFKAQGEDVTALDNLTRYELDRADYKPTARMHNFDYIHKLGCNFIKADIRNPLIKDDFDYIIHTAAQPAMTVAIEEPWLDLTTNIIGTYNVLELARQLDVPIVNCSTIHLYGNNINDTLTEEETRFTAEPATIGEDHPILNGDVTPLHASKRSAELYVQAFAETYGLKAASFRLTGMYGPRQFGSMDHGWVANFAIRAITGKPITLFGTGKQVRDILYAGDAARAFDLWLDGGKSRIYNIGGGPENIISLQECIELISEITETEVNPTLDDPRFGDLYYFASDIARATKDFGWTPQVSNREGIEKLVTWIQNNMRLFG